MSSTFLRKRTFIFAEDEEEDVGAFPPSPSKRRSTLVMSSQQASFDLKPVAAPNFHIFAASAAAADLGSDQREERDTSDDSQAPSSSTSNASTELSPIACSTTLSSSSATSEKEGTTPPLKMKMGLSDGPITPPSTPTRATSTKRTSRPSLPTRTSSSSKLVVYCDNDDIENTHNTTDSPVALAPTGTPRRSRRSGLLTPLDASPSSSSPALNASKGNNNQTTGLTPALNKMMKPTKDVMDANSKATKGRKVGKGAQDENANDENAIPSKAQQGYSTPKRLQRTTSHQNVTLPLSQGKANSTASSRATSPSLSTGSAPTSTAPKSTTLGYYQDAKALFRRTTEPHRLVGRVAERETIRTFCQNHILTAKAGSLYISGQPGTGKTALLKEVMRDMEGEMQSADHEIKTIMINCMTIKDPRLVYAKMLEEMGYVAESKDKETVIKTLETLVLDNKKKAVMFVAILDEIDQLLTKDQEVLYKLFQWSTTEGSRLTLVGIANALDMTDRFLPRLKARNCEPQLLNFNPYQVAEIRDIIMDRLFSVEDSNKADERDENGKPRVAPLMQRPAIELCARKVAAATGDLRKALDICRQTIEMVEVETKKKERAQQQQQQGRPSALAPLSEIRLADLENRAAGGADRASLVRRSTTGSMAELTGAQDGSGPITLQDAPKVTVAHVQKALASAFGSPLVQKMKGLNVHQQIILTVLVMKIKGGKTVDCEVGKVFDHFTSTCRSSNKIGALSRGEYQDLINMLEANGLITLGKAKEDRLRKIGLVPRESEVLDAIKGQDILDTIVTKAGLKPAVTSEL
ncbi:AAA ATPase [Linnemannia hyalina]|uniref:AAA ATPase n=1 Tax=Linnemannia hyalina TaxID=64524 RepID=A0A9P8BRV4_9FUNG|nr:AAA ATPase [Linnemannia hyalina]